MHRFASAPPRLRPESEAIYEECHRSVWPEMLHTITRCNIHNYSLSLQNGTPFQLPNLPAMTWRPIWRK